MANLELTNNQLPILRKDRSSSGIPNLDILLEGGYLKSGLIMFIGPSGMEKNAFAFHYTQAGIKNNEFIIYITADMDHEDLLKKSSSLGFDFKKAVQQGKMKFIDCYSSSLGDTTEKPSPMKEVISLPGPSSLNDLSLSIKGVLQENPDKHIRVIFHSLSTFVLYNPSNSIIKFLQVVGGRLKKANATTMLLVEEGMHEKTLLTSLEYMMDEKYLIHDTTNFSLEAPTLPMVIPLKLGSAGIELR